MQTNPSKAVTFIVAENQIEIIRSSAVRGVVSNRQKHTLVTLDENNQPVHYTIDSEPFRRDVLDEEEGASDPVKVEAAVAAAVFEAAAEGKTFYVLSKRVPTLEVKA